MNLQMKSTPQNYTKYILTNLFDLEGPGFLLYSRALIGFVWNMLGLMSIALAWFYGSWPRRKYLGKTSIQCR